jgi:hypothetical protein
MAKINKAEQYLINMANQLCETRRRLFTNRVSFLSQYYPDLLPLVIDYILVKIQASKPASEDIYYQPLSDRLAKNPKSELLIHSMTQRMIRLVLLTPLSSNEIKKIHQDVSNRTEKKRPNH